MCKSYDSRALDLGLSSLSVDIRLTFSSSSPNVRFRFATDSGYIHFKIIQQSNYAIGESESLPRQGLRILEAYR
jgi:hypothetical protein